MLGLLFVLLLLLVELSYEEVALFVEVMGTEAKSGCSGLKRSMRCTMAHGRARNRLASN